jgi:hypothetical protein
MGLSRQEFDWDTRTVPDGWYDVVVQTTGGAGIASVPASLHQWVWVDNTPPQFSGVGWTRGKAGQIEIRGWVEDASRICDVAYIVDSGGALTGAEPADGVLSSGREEFTASLAGLVPGMHIIAIQATGEEGKTGVVFLRILLDDPDKWTNDADLSVCPSCRSTDRLSKTQPADEQVVSKQEAGQAQK